MKMIKIFKKKKNQIKLESRVEYKVNKKKGTIKYFGKLQNDKNNFEWVGIDWDEEGVGKNDGTAFGVRYFQTKMDKGTFIDLQTFKDNFIINNNIEEIKNN